jgi:hypothetical protein
MVRELEKSLDSVTNPSCQIERALQIWQVFSLGEAGSVTSVCFPISLI